MPGKVTLHDEIVAILRESGVASMSTSEIAARVNARGRYQKRDGSAVTAYQIHGRTKNYSDLFDRDGTRVSLRGSERSVSGPRGPLSPAKAASQAAQPVEALVSSAVKVLSEPGKPIEVAAKSAPHQAGLYALTVSARGADELGLSDVSGPVYVGKAEDSLASRDIDQHFADGNTGRSTVRRTLAALLASKINLVAMPRNPTRPADFDRYALEALSDRRLTEWMEANLRIAFWVAPAGSVLRPIEAAVIRHFSPPLNLTDVVTPYTAGIKARRRAMADQARAYHSRA